METTQAIILTSIFNIIFTGLIGGIVIYVIQKKIDATIQKSLFEHQTRFTRTYQDMVESLRTLHQKFLVYKASFQDIVSEALMLYPYVDETGKKQLGRIAEEGEQVSRAVENGISETRKKYDDFFYYFQNNRLFLSENTCTEIQNNILKRHDLMDFAIELFRDDVPEAFTKFGKNAAEMLGFEVATKPDLEKSEYPALILEMDKELEKQAQFLEMLYKSVAEAQ